MTYRITENINLPFKIIPVINEFDKKIEVRIKLKSIFDKTIFANNVVLKVPCPNNTASANTVAGIGRAKYEAEHHGIMWRIKKYPGECIYSIAFLFEYFTALFMIRLIV
jgi:AP-2 complex subunit mu-1